MQEKNKKIVTVQTMGAEARLLTPDGSREVRSLLPQGISWWIKPLWPERLLIE